MGPTQKLGLLAPMSRLENKVPENSGASALLSAIALLRSAIMSSSEFLEFAIKPSHDPALQKKEIVHAPLLGGAERRKS